MALLDTALDCIRRGWFVFPCVPRTKRPAIEGGFLNASNQESDVQLWWKKWPDANVAIATGASGLCVVDVDHGIGGTTLDSLPLWLDASRTYVVRTGRRPEFGVQVYYSGTGLKSTGWEAKGLAGDIRCSTGYVMAAGSIHPSGEPYTLLCDAPVQPVPDYVRGLTSKAEAAGAVTSVDDAEADTWLAWLYEYADRAGLVTRDYEKRVPNGWWIGVDCPWVTDHSSGAGAESSTVLGILDGKLAFECSHSSCKAAKRNTQAFRELLEGVKADWLPEPVEDPLVLIGKPKAPDSDRDPWAKYHTPEQVLNAPPVTFLIQDFLTEDAVSVIAAPVAQRKSIIALNVVHSLVTGEPLFNHFEVKKQPERVLYCCPEMGIQSFSARLKSIGLAPYLGKTLFCTTMASDPFELKDITPGELEGAVVVLDTAIRFLKGDESNAGEMSVFAATVFRLIKDGAASVLLLHHSKKGTSEATELTLDNVMRGSGELGAFVACVWATRLQDGKDEYRTPSYLENVKKRDFDSQPFQVLPVEGSYRLTFDAKLAVLSRPPRQKRDLDGREAEALAAIAAIRKTEPGISYDRLSARLLEHGIERSGEWIRKRDKRPGKPGAVHRSD